MAGEITQTIDANPRWITPMMTEMVMELSRDLFQTALMVALPALAVGLLVGLIVSIVQAVTSIQDQTLGHVPRLLLVGLVLVLTMGFTLQLAVAFTQRMLQQAARVEQVRD